jgi:excisionase family DNA binding protein
MIKEHLTPEEHNAILIEIKDIFREGLEQYLNRDKKEYTLLSRKDTAEILCVSLPTLHEWTKTGIIKAHRIGGRILYKLTDLDDALEEIKTF